MLIAILSDIHGNMEALSEVLREIDRVDPDEVFSLGDNIGYGPDPEQVMQIIQARRIPSVLGNHELALNKESFIKWFNPVSAQAVFHFKSRLSASSIHHIRSYPLSRVWGETRMVHGMPPSSPAVYLHQVSDQRIRERLMGIRERIVFIGHTHILALIEDDGKKIIRKAWDGARTLLDRKRRYLVNAGSVGQPRDGDNRARFLLYDTEAALLEARYVPYDYQKTAAKIIQEGLPRSFAEKLQQGGA